VLQPDVHGGDARISICFCQSTEPRRPCAVFRARLAGSMPLQKAGRSRSQRLCEKIVRPSRSKLGKFDRLIAITSDIWQLRNVCEYNGRSRSAGGNLYGLGNASGVGCHARSKCGAHNDVIVGQLLRLCWGDEDHAHRTASNVRHRGEAHVSMHPVRTHTHLHRGPYLSAGPPWSCFPDGRRARWFDGFAG
jgi:hypothetical protein